MRRAPVAALSAVVAASLCACGGAPGPSGGTPAAVSARGLPLADVLLERGGTVLLRLTAEVAADTASQEKGLSGLRHVPADQGMAFVFPGPSSTGFWMKDTLVPLDIAFADAQEHVVDVQTMQPCHADPCPVYDAAQPYTTALETAAGVLTGVGLRRGDALHLAARGPTAAPSGR